VLSDSRSGERRLAQLDPSGPEPSAEGELASEPDEPEFAERESEGPESEDPESEEPKPEGGESMSDTVLSLSAQRRPVLADALPAVVGRDLALVVGGAGLVGLLAQVSVHLPFTPVPITGQTLGVLLVGTALGARRGVLALLLYGLAGLAGMPWFAGGTHGDIGPNLGYVIGFVLAAGVCGWLAERGAGHRVDRTLASMVAGEVALYAVGVPWLAVWLHIGLGRALLLGWAPFVVGDAVKAVLAATVLPLAWRLPGVGDTRHTSDARPSSGGRV